MKNRFKEKTAWLNGYYVASVSFLKRYRTLLASSVAILFFAIASLVTPTQSSVEGEVDRLEKRLQNRERQLERYAIEALDNPVDQWYKPEDFPEDMVIYKYNADTLQCWVNQFPISNDEVDAIPLWYTLGYANSENIWNMPLAYLSDSEQYVNLGSAWYVVKVYKKERAKVIAGLLVKTEYLSDNSVLVNEINPELKVKRELEIVPIRIMHYKLPILGFRTGRLAYITDGSYIPENQFSKLENLDVLIINAIRHEPHLSHFSLPQALEMIERIGAKRNYLTHLSHQIGTHVELSRELPENVEAAYDGLKVYL